MVILFNRVGNFLDELDTQIYTSDLGIDFIRSYGIEHVLEYTRLIHALAIMEEFKPSLGNFYQGKMVPIQFYKSGTDFMTNQPKYRSRSDD